MKNSSVCQLLSHVRFFGDPMDYSPPGSSVHEILQARVLEWVAIVFASTSYAETTTPVVIIFGDEFLRR